MSFILDALKKSETERQRQDAPGIADVPEATESRSTPRWLWLLVALLAVNLAVLVGLMVRPDAVTAPPPETLAREEPEPAEPVREAPAEAAPQPAADESPAVEQAPQPVRERPASQATVRPAAAPPARVPASRPLHTYDEVRANGTLVLPDLHLDILVYSEDPSSRFVFVNMTKYQENATLAEGPVIREITPEGVVLEHMGTGFLLPRE